MAVIQSKVHLKKKRHFISYPREKTNLLPYKELREKRMKEFFSSLQIGEVRFQLLIEGREG